MPLLNKEVIICTKIYALKYDKPNKTIVTAVKITFYRLKRT